MTSQLEITVEGAMGVIALNRPEAINALSLEMIEGISVALARWRDDDRIRAVLFEGRGPKGFCAGGDVRAVRALVLSGRKDAAKAYFASEYRMNAQIASYIKPTIALAHGVVMGGGIGIAGHCRYRITVPGARFAMPEVAIGFFCDVGVSAILAKTPLNRALLFELSGVSVGAEDALALGLSDCVVAPERLSDMRAGLIAAAGAAHPDEAIAGLMEAESIIAGDAKLSGLADLLPPDMPDSAEAFVARVAEVPALSELSALIATRSPSSLTANFMAQLAARRVMDVEATLRADLRLAVLMGGHPDFAEGVRAVLVDKDNKPVWRPGRLGDVDSGPIEAALRGA